MQLQLWGVRGSTSGSCVTSARYGCNTSCYAINTDPAPYIILDAGTGLRKLGACLKDGARIKECAIFLTHSHWDHVSGMPFFIPLYSPQWSVTIYAPESIGGLTPVDFINSLFSSTFFPVTWDQLASKRKIVPLSDGQVINLEGGVRVSAHATNHGGEDVNGLYACAYRVERNNKSIFYSGDHELGPDPDSLDRQSSFFKGLRGADIAILDSQYTLDNYAKHQGWGHSSIEQWPPIVHELGVRVFMPTHYDPSYDDDLIDDISMKLIQEDPRTKDTLIMAYEGLTVDCDEDLSSSDSLHVAPDIEDCNDCQFSSELMDIPDMSTVLDRLLLRARNISKADAGTIYLLEEDELVFSYSHNDTLFTSVQSARQQYLNARLPIAPDSIAGYIAYTHKILNINDVRNLPKDAPYSFNQAFDDATGYRTVSICGLPIFSQRGKLLGVMQVINAMRDDTPVPFTISVESTLRKLCQAGAQGIEQAINTREMLLRLLETTRMRDPTETGPHVFRVGAMAAELYHHWAEKRGVDILEISDTKSHLRLASMLHDVGKVGISDQILKKPGPFTFEERQIMQKHCAIGAAIFKDASTTLDKLASSIAMHHHQRWDGKGYCGAPEGPILSGEDIPFEARITSIVDVFDALLAPRCYKAPIPLEKSLEIIKKDSGTAFDPQMVEDFLEILDTMLAIQEKYKDDPALQEEQGEYT